MKLRTVVHLLSGARVESVWRVVTDEEFDQIRDGTEAVLYNQPGVFKCLEDNDPANVECEVYIPVRNIDTITIETTSADDSIAAIS
jgi:phage gp45-like